MQYPDTMERSAELLRLALPMMSKQPASRHPVSYAVWYEHVSGRNPALSAEVHKLTAQGAQLSEVATRELYRKHIAGSDEAATARIKEELERVIQEVAASTSESTSKAAAYGSSLAAWSRQLSAGGQDTTQLIEQISSIVHQTNDTQASMSRLQSVLEESQAEVAQLRGELVRAREEAATDALTGLTNRKGFDEALAEMTRAALETARDLCLMMIDIDHFKKVNDTYGHVFGDRVIRGVAQVLKASLKGRDVAARYGGEEFAVLLPDTPSKGAQVIAEQIRASIQKGRIKRLDKDEFVDTITISIGITQYRRREDPTEFVSRADAGLYASKTGGRNRATLY